MAASEAWLGWVRAGGHRWGDISGCSLSWEGSELSGTASTCMFVGWDAVQVGKRQSTGAEMGAGQGSRTSFPIRPWVRGLGMQIRLIIDPRIQGSQTAQDRPPAPTGTVAFCTHCKKHILSNFSIPETANHLVDGVTEPMENGNGELLKSPYVYFLILFISLWQWSGLYFVNPGVLACVKAVWERKKKQKMQLLASRTLIFWLEGCEGSRTFAWSLCTVGAP